MKVLMTTDAVGGIWVYARELTAALESSGDVEVTLACIGPAPPPDDAVPYHPGLLEWQEEPWDDVEETGRWLGELADRTQPDVVHLNSYALGALGWNSPVVVAGHSCVYSWHESVRGAPPDASWGRYRDEVRRGIAAADAIVAPTRWMLDQLGAHYGVGERGRVIYNGVSPHPHAAAAKQPFVLAAGRLWDEAKGLDALDAAAGQLRWSVRVAGEGRSGATPANVELLGPLPRDELRAWMGRAAIFAHPARYEPFGLVVLEAALAGCALVLGDIPTLRELWDGAACFVPPGDSAALASTIGALAADDDRRRDLAAAARARAAQHQARPMAAEYARLYTQLPHGVAA
jgi:glycogen synthase